MRARETSNEGGSSRRKKRDCSDGQSKWIMRWPHNVKTPLAALADVWSVDVEALQECLSRFPKIEALDTEQKEASKALISGKASLHA